MKRVVVTSSCAAVLQVEPEPKTFSELDWNQQAPKEVAELGRAAPAITKYRASKTLAERGVFLVTGVIITLQNITPPAAAWEFFEKHKNEIGWDLVVLNPPFVFGVCVSYRILHSYPVLLDLSIHLIHISAHDQPRTHPRRARHLRPSVLHHIDRGIVPRDPPHRLLLDRRPRPRPRARSRAPQGPSRRRAHHRQRRAVRMAGLACVLVFYFVFLFG